MPLPKVLVSLVVVGVLAGCGGDDKDASRGPVETAIAGDFSIAGVLSYTGSLVVGQGLERAMRIAIGEINDQGGVQGKTLGLDICDSGSDPAGAQTCVDAVSTDSTVTSFVGPSTSSQLIAVAPSIKADAIVAMSPSASSPAITALDDNGYVNRDIPSDAQQGLVAAHIAHEAGYATVFVANVDDPYGNGLGDRFIDVFESLGGSAPRATFASDAPDYATTAQAAVDAAPEAIFLVGFYQESALFVNAFYNLAPSSTVKWLLCDGNHDVRFVSLVNQKEKLVGSFGTVPATPTTANYQSFASTYLSTYGTADETYGANAYDAVYLLAIAMQFSSDPLSRSGLRDNLHNTGVGAVVNAGDWASVLAHAADGHVNYEGASGSVDLDATGEVTSDVTKWTIDENYQLQNVECRLPTGEICPS